MKKYLLLIAVLAVFVTSCQPKTIGGDKDEHGCLIAAGYSWDNEIGACIRPWELDESQMKAAKIAVMPLSVSPVTIDSVETLRCPGCFIVNIRSLDYENTFSIKLVDWKIASDESATHICTDEEKQAEICTLEYMPVCGDNGKTYGNKCSACASKEIDSYVEGECPDNTKAYVCTDISGKNAISLEEAKEIAAKSECGDNLILECSCPKGYRAEGETCNPECYYSRPKCLAPSVQCIVPYICNQYTGTFWIDLDIEKEGCNPACVINLETKEAEINWRCTGAIPTT